MLLQVLRKDEMNKKIEACANDALHEDCDEETDVVLTRFFLQDKLLTYFM